MGRFLLGLQSFDGSVERGIGGRGRLAKLERGLLHGDVGSESLLVDHRFREIEKMGEQQTAAIWEADKTLARGATECPHLSARAVGGLVGHALPFVLPQR